MPELLLGCGSNHIKQMGTAGRHEWDGLVTMDFNGDHKPDVIHDISKLPLPFEDDTFDEIHAYEVLEHVGSLGDWRFFFDQWSDFWRVLKPGGRFLGHSPHHASPWAFGDPGHTRVITLESFSFLHQPAYTNQVGKTAMTDYRFCYEADFDVCHSEESDGHIFFILQAVKPSRIVRPNEQA
jgi:cyclopropane fatty-acyl-phospholipid synthase-like methyltransferase